jgi:hypothetical protein
MSRRRRHPVAAAAPVIAPAPTLPALSRPIQVDTSQLEIPDLPLLMKLQTLDTKDQAQIQAAIVGMVPMLERLVVGGLAGFKIAELPAVVVEVFQQIGRASNPGN